MEIKILKMKVDGSKRISLHAVTPVTSATSSTFCSLHTSLIFAVVFLDWTTYREE